MICLNFKVDFAKQKSDDSGRLAKTIETIQTQEITQVSFSFKNYFCNLVTPVLSITGKK